MCTGHPFQKSQNKRRKKHFFVGEVDTRPDERKVFGDLSVDYKGRKVIVRNSEQQRKYNATTMGFHESDHCYDVKVTHLNTQTSEMEHLPPLC